MRRLACFLVPAAALFPAAVPVPPFFLLDPTAFAPLLRDDLSWASASIPFFESSDANLTASFYLRARVLKAHIVETNVSAFPYVITEFAPFVPWAGRANAIPCAAGHHLAEARWLRGSAAVVADSYSGWWASNVPGVRSNYYSWITWALSRRMDVAGPRANLAIVKALLPNMTSLVLSFMAGTLPSSNAGVIPTSNGCVWNAPGNEGQERSLSGPGCRPLVQALLYGEAASLVSLCDLAGNATCAAIFTERAAFFRARTLELWHPLISSFDTLQIAHPPPPPSPPPPPGYAPFSVDTFCCDQTACTNGHARFLYEGALDEGACAAKCDAWPGGECHYITVSQAPWCQAAEWCNTTAPFAGGGAVTYERKGGGGSSSSNKRTRVNTLPPPFAGVRELASLSSPWLFGAVPPENASFFSASWETAFDSYGLGGAFGLRTAEARAPGYTCAKGMCCDWSGPVWPFESSKALTAATNILHDPVLAPQVPALTRARHWALLLQYVAQHTSAWWISDGADKRANYSEIAAEGGRFFDGLGHAWIAEAGCAEDGQWTDDWREGYRYLHSSFMDIVITAVVGINPHAAAMTPMVDIMPLQPSDEALSFWALDAVVVGGRTLTVWWDADGTRYGRGVGLFALVDGVVASHSPTTQLAAPGLVVIL